MVSVAATFIGSGPPWKKEQSTSQVPALEVMRVRPFRGGREAEVGHGAWRFWWCWRNGWGTSEAGGARSTG